MHFPPYAAAMIEKLNTAGFAAYAVGGCVRDTLLGRTPADWDITTAALPEETMAVFADAPFTVRADNGLRHGTVTVILEGDACEITTFRTEGTYTDHRRPDSVTFVTDVRDDLSRRDFTVNAMAAAPAADGTVTVIDPFGGRDDLTAGILRAVGEPEKRFTEDALRILRGMRFAARYGFTVEAETVRAMHRCAPLLDEIAPERIGDELRGILKAPHCAAVLKQFSDIADRLLPGCAADGATLPIADTPAVRLSCLLSPCPPERAETMLLRYGFGTATARKTALYLTLQNADISRRDVRCQIADECGRDGVVDYFAFRRALSPTDETLPHAEAAVTALFTPGVCYNVATLAVSGADLITAGIPKGPALGQILRALTDAVIAGNLPNDRDALMEAARRLP